MNSTTVGTHVVSIQGSEDGLSENFILVNVFGHLNYRVIETVTVEFRQKYRLLQCQRVFVVGELHLRENPVPVNYHVSEGCSGSTLVFCLEYRHQPTAVLIAGPVSVYKNKGVVELIPSGAVLVSECGHVLPTTLEH